MGEPEQDPAPELEEEAGPWEEPGAVRRDCEPHRGAWLLLLAWVALFCALCVTLFNGLNVVALVFGFIVYGLPQLLTLVGLPLGAAAWIMARRDLIQMRAGVMDPAGEPSARLARKLGIVSVGLIVSSTLCNVLALVLGFVFR
jgi:hypothetical protein